MTADGKPVADAEIVVESWDVGMPGYSKNSLVHTSVTRTDSDGRWSVPGRTTLRFALPVPEMPTFGDELTVRAAGLAPVHIALDFRPDTRSPEEKSATMRVTWDGPGPWSLLTLPTFGIAGGAGQEVAVHVGGMIIADHQPVGVGLRGDLGAGVNASTAAVGAVIVPLGGRAMPILGVEVNGRYMRPWPSDGSRRVEWGTELGFDFDSWRLTVTLLGPSALTPLDRRRVVVGFGWGYF